jgi:dinuclear metal center YbgI/SA1388 family protein
MTGTVAHIVRILDRLAPPRLAESWDNVGLQLGDPSWPVKKIWTALDPLPEVVAKACEQEVDVLVTHHPLFFKPIQRIDCGKPLGRIVEMALSRRLAIFSAHTNLDSVQGGVNDVLAGRMGLGHLRVLADPVDADMVKLVVFVPSDHTPVIMDTLFTLEAGRIGNYRCCTFRCEGVGTFFPEDDAAPAVGKRNMLSEVKENRIEIIVAKGDLSTVVNAVEHVHPYESVAYDVYPTQGPGLSDRSGPGGQAVLSNDAGRLLRPVEIRVEPVDGKGCRQARGWRSRRSRSAPGAAPA